MNRILARLATCAFSISCLLLVTAPIACTGERSGDAGDTAAAGRRIAAARWDTLWVLGGAMQDSVLPHPSRLAAAGDRVYVFDASAARLLAVSAADGSVV